MRRGSHARRRLGGFFSTLLVGLALILAASGLGAVPAAPQAAFNWEGVGDEAVGLLRDYLRIDTSNPPGNEAAAARFLARVLERERIDYELVDSAPGRANLVARLRGDGSAGGAVVLLNHMDVVPADTRYWNAEPFGGELREGRLYGRGAIDMKSYGVVQLMALVALKRSRTPLGRDVVLMATAGEETGGASGVGYLLEQRPDLAQGVEFVLNEGGALRRVGGRDVHFVETSQKTPLWLRLRARGVGGHGAQALTDSAVNRLVRALDRIRTFRPQIRLVPRVADMIRASADLVQDRANAAALRDVERNIARPEFMELLERDYGTVLRSTIAITVLEGASNTNVIPPEASAELDCRLLPGDDADLFVATLRDVIDDPLVEIETLLRVEPAESPSGTALWAAIETVTRARDPRALLVPSVLPGFTDSHYFRSRGVVAYGWTPIAGDPADGPAHGADESVSAKAVSAAPRLLFEVLRLLATPVATTS